MPMVSTNEASEKLAHAVEKATKQSALSEIYAELFPEKTPGKVLASEIAQHIRSGIAAEELVDLWNVVFPEDRHVWYDEETRSIRYNEEMVGYAD